MRLTVPQIHMLSHAAHCNHEMMQERIEAERKEKERQKEHERRDPKMANGKRLSEMPVDEMLIHLRGNGE